MKRAILACFVIGLAAACSDPAAGTSVRIALRYDDALHLETADVIVRGETINQRIAHELLVLLPDDLAGAEMAIEVWGRAGGKRAAYGTATATPVRDRTVSARVELAACAPGCDGNTLMACGGPVTCEIGCVDDTPTTDAHCLAAAPSNGVDPGDVAMTESILITEDATFDTDTGLITGGLQREPGSGVRSGIGYRAVAQPNSTVELGVFAFRDLTIGHDATVQIIGSRAAVLLVGGVANIGGILDLTGGRGDRTNAGPGGGIGARSTAEHATGCGPGGDGGKSITGTGGGGGGAGGSEGPQGGMGAGAAAAGTGHAACINALLEPLVGGSGGGLGANSSAASYARGGGGGGALQITALGSLELTGRIDAGAEGGAAGPLAGEGGGASGAGAGAGGGILLEAPMVTIADQAALTANGGGGGGGGTSSAGTDGQHGPATNDYARGGDGGTGGAGGGTGGAANSPADVGQSANHAGGGGGGFGAIAIRGTTRSLSSQAIYSPTPMEAPLAPPK